MNTHQSVTAEDQRALISFDLGPQAFCVDIMQVREIRGWTAVTHLPEAPKLVRGAMALRGTIIPVIDLGERVTARPVEESERSVIIVV